MGLTNDNMVMPVAPSGGMGGFGGDSGWWLLLIILFATGGWGGFGGYGGAGALAADGAMLYPWMNQSQQVNNGFRDQMLNTSINGIQQSITSGFGDVQTALCGGFAGVNASINGAQSNITNQLYNNTIADLERSFAAQTASTQGMNAIQSQLASCCCDNKANTNELKYVIATENCADRAAVSDGIRDVLAATQAQTQAILDKMCQNQIEQKNDTIAQLRSELMFARGQASQDIQTAAIQAGQRTLANEIEQYVAPRAIPSYAVQNPNCCAPTGCACGF